MSILDYDSYFMDECSSIDDAPEFILFNECNYESFKSKYCQKCRSFKKLQSNYSLINILLEDTQYSYQIRYFYELIFNKKHCVDFTNINILLFIRDHLAPKPDLYCYEKFSSSGDSNF